uniref:Uncharacterized protein n=1 Tax=Arundo donax TaxID=35708 RepID=A0A0A8ZFN2_ARUDO
MPYPCFTFEMQCYILCNAVNKQVLIYCFQIKNCKQRGPTM